MAAKAVPKFNHRKEASIVESSDGRYVEQGGHLFTYAVHDRFARRFIPEPIYVPPEKNPLIELTSEFLEGVDSLISKLQTVADTLKDAFKDGKKVKPRTSRKDG